MKNMPSQLEVIELKPRFLWFLILAYTMVIAFANWFDPRLVQIFGLTTDAGTLIFPLTFLLSDLITEIYGFKHARRAIWCGFLFNLFFIIYGQIIIHMPNPDYPTNNAAFDTLLAMNARIILASTVSYFCSEPANSFIMAKLKIIMNGRHMGIRFIASTFFASGIDSFIFTTIAFYRTLSNANLLALILTMWFIKVAVEMLGLPISVKLAKKLKQMEGLDIYDRRTNFNLFRLNAYYLQQDNEFGRHDS
jgi:queuosine precursor transporter